MIDKMMITLLLNAPAMIGVLLLMHTCPHNMSWALPQDLMLIGVSVFLDILAIKEVLKK